MAAAAVIGVAGIVMAVVAAGVVEALVLALFVFVAVAGSHNDFCCCYLGDSNSVRCCFCCFCDGNGGDGCCCFFYCRSAIP